MAKKKAIGFGFDPTETGHHFLVVIPRSINDDIAVYERFNWENEKELQVDEIVDENLKVTIDREKWEMIKDPITSLLNMQLKDKNITVGRFKTGQVPLERLLGKELTLLLWAIEDSDPQLIPTAIRNWSGLSREERWWLFTMTNATTGHADNKRGWRKAVRFALTENPIENDETQGNILELLYKNV